MNIKYWIQDSGYLQGGKEVRRNSISIYNVLFKKSKANVEKY